MNILDLIIAPFYLLIIYFVAFIIRSLNPTNALIQRYFIPALTVRLFGATIFGLVYFFYYGNGDTANYYRDSLAITNLLLTDPSTGISFLFADPKTIVYNYFNVAQNLIFYNDPASLFITKTAAIFNIFSFGVYTVTSFFYSIIGLSGSWALFIVLNRMYPALQKKTAYACLFIPSLFFWGSGIMKDTISFSAMCWIIYSVHNIFISKDKRVKNIMILLLCTYIVYIVKIYILVCLIPAVTPWVVIQFNSNIKNRGVRTLLKPVLLIFAIGIGILGVGKLSQSNERYSLDKIVATSQVTAYYIKTVSDNMGGSSYDIGILEPSVGGFLKILFPAINVALYRPYVWEVKNPLMLLSAFESLYFLILSIRLLFTAGVAKIFQAISGDPFILFCIIFSTVFAFATGISTNNFGSLVRYKLPLLPLYLTAIYLIMYKTSKNYDPSKES